MQFHRQHGLLSAKTFIVGCSVTASSGYDMESIIKARMRDWYSRLVAAADPAMLAPVEIGDRLTLTIADDGTGIVNLPEETVKVLAVEMEGWRRAATVTADPLSRIALRQRSPYSRGCPESPVAVIDGSKMKLYTPAPGAASLSVKPDIYHIDSAALATIQSFYTEITP